MPSAAAPMPKNGMARPPHDKFLRANPSDPPRKRQTAAASRASSAVARARAAEAAVGVERALHGTAEAATEAKEGERRSVAQELEQAHTESQALRARLEVVEAEREAERWPGPAEPRKADARP